MPITRAERIVGEWKEGRGKLGTRFSLYDDLSRVMRPDRIGFQSEISDGDQRTQELFDSTAALAAVMLRNNSISFTVPKAKQWGKAKAKDKSINERQDVREWFDVANKRTHDAIYQARAQFGPATEENFDDLVVYGQGCTWHAEATDRQSQVFRTIHLKNIVTKQNTDGRIDTVFEHLPMTARDAMQRNLPLPDSVQQSVRDGNLDAKIEYLHRVQPAGLEPDERQIDDGSPFVSTMVELSEKEIVEDRNVAELPYHNPRWGTISGGEPWSPGRLALPDAGTLNAMTRTLLKAGQLQVTPPYLTPDARSANMVRLIPGHPIVYDMEQARTLGRIPIQPFPTGANIPLGDGMANDRREMIWAIFLRNVLNLPVDAPAMTATEVVQRRDEMLRVVEPTFGRLESEFSAPVFVRAFGIELRAGRLTAGNEMPQALSGAKLDYEFNSPIQRVREMVDALQSAVMLEQLAPLGAIKPDIYDNIDGDKISRQVVDAMGPSEWLLPIAQVAALREQRAIQAQQEQQFAMLQAAAQAAPQTAERVIDGVAQEVLPAA